MYTAAGVINAHREREVKCYYPGCTEMVITKTPRGVKYCERHRKMMRQQYEQRRAKKRRAKKSDRKPGRPKKCFRWAQSIRSPCNNCSFLSKCRIIVEKKIYEDPFCFVDSPGRVEFEKVYGDKHGNESI